MTMSALVALGSVALTGCQATQTPDVEVAEVRVADQSEDGARLVVTLQLTNPTTEEWPLERADYRVSIDGFETFSITGFMPDPVITPEGTILLELGAAFDTGGANVIGQAYRVSGVVAYRPPGELRDIAFDSGVPLPAVAFSDEGSLE